MSGSPSFLRITRVLGIQNLKCVRVRACVHACVCAAVLLCGCVCLCECFVCLYGHQVHSYRLWEPEEVVRFLKLELEMVMSHHVSAENQTQFL